MEKREHQHAPTAHPPGGSPKRLPRPVRALPVEQQSGQEVRAAAAGVEQQQVTVSI